MDGKLPGKVIKGVEPVRIVEAFLVLAVRALDLAVVARGIGTNELVVDSKLISSILKERAPIAMGVGKAVGEFKAVVGLNSFYLHAFAGKSGYNLFQGVSGGSGALLGVSAQDAEAGVLVDGGVLVEA